jgi:hypothetical protein
MAKCDCVIFTGPSLPWSEVASVDQRIRCGPPAVRGDISKASKTGVTIIGLIDGVFFNRAAVSHREIIEAIKLGVTVVGGSSMGALRVLKRELLKQMMKLPWGIIQSLTSLYRTHSSICVMPYTHS